MKLQVHIIIVFKFVNICEYLNVFPLARSFNITMICCKYLVTFSFELVMGFHFPILCKKHFFSWNKCRNQLFTRCFLLVYVVKTQQNLTIFTTAWNTWNFIISISHHVSKSNIFSVKDQSRLQSMFTKSKREC